MNHESASYKSYKEELSDKTYVDYVLADGERNKLFSLNYVNTIGYQEFVDKYIDCNNSQDSELFTNVVKYIESEHIKRLLTLYDINERLCDLAIRHLNVTLKLNDNIPDDVTENVINKLNDNNLLINVESIFDYDYKYTIKSYAVRYKTVKYLENSLLKVGVSNSTIQHIKYKEYEEKVLTDVVLSLKESGLKVKQFYGTSYFLVKDVLLTYCFTYSADLEKLQKFVDSFDYMQSVPSKYLLYLYNGDLRKDIVYRGITIIIRNVNECIDKFLLQKLSFKKSFKSLLND